MKVLITDGINDGGKIEKKIFGNKFKIIIPKINQINNISNELWSNVDGILTFDSLNFDRRIISNLKKCKIIVRIGTGFDNIDLEETKKKKIIVSNVPDYGIDEVSDHAMSLLLALNRDIFNLVEKTKLGIWKRTGGNILRLEGKTIGIIGLGRIGSAMAIKAKVFKMKVIFFDPYKDNGYDKIYNIKRVDTLRDLAKYSDFISLHCPLTKETKNLINENFFKYSKKNSIIINTSRGAVIDLVSLRNALVHKKIKAAGLDVLPEEPPSNNNLLIKDFYENKIYLRNKLIITPHVAFYSNTSIIEIRKKAAIEMKTVLQGGRAKNCVNNFYE